MAIEETPPPGGDDEDFATLFEQTSRKGPAERLQVGQAIEGRLLQIGPEWAFLDIGAKGEALMASAELCDENGLPQFQIGERIEGRVLRKREEGVVITRVVQKGREAREMLEDVHQLGLPVEGVVKGVIKGGLEVDISGVRAFCPASQIDLHYNEDLTAFVGQRFTFRIAEYRDSGRSIVVSRRALLEEEQAKRAVTTRERLSIGAVFTGTVTSVREYGAFVDIGGIEGLLHVSELGHVRVQRTADLLRVGQEVEVQVIKMEGEKLSLSMKSLAPDPWTRAGEAYAEGTSHRGVVTRVQPFGGFVEIAPGVEGLLHVSNLGDPRIKDARHALSEGQEVSVTVASLDLARKRLGLALSEMFSAGPAKLAPGEMVTGKVERVEPYGVFLRLPGPPVGGRPPRGLIPLEEIGPSKGDLRHEFPPGAEVPVVIVEPDAQGRMRLSRRAALDAQERGLAAGYLQEQPTQAGFGTLGDLLSKKGGDKRKR
jgi:small subunit ribosomal protein S1